jgi:hypothetical protein
MKLDVWATTAFSSSVRKELVQANAGWIVWARPGESMASDAPAWGSAVGGVVRAFGWGGHSSNSIAPAPWCSRFSSYDPPVLLLHHRRSFVEPLPPSLLPIHSLAAAPPVADRWTTGSAHRRTIHPQRLSSHTLIDRTSTVDAPARASVELAFFFSLVFQ